jgi:hypothetical protein
MKDEWHIGKESTSIPNHTHIDVQKDDRFVQSTENKLHERQIWGQMLNTTPSLRNPHRK